MKKTIILTALLLLGLFVHAQPNLDSLWGVWNDESKEDTCRLKALQKIIRDGYLDTNIDSVLVLAKLQYDFAEKTGSKYFMARSLLSQGEYWNRKDDQEKALVNLHQSLMIRKELNDIKGVAFCLREIADIYRLNGDYSKALDSYNELLELYDELNDKTNIAIVNMTIGYVYRIRGDYVSAINYYNQSVSLFREVGAEKNIAASLNNIANVYYNQGIFPKALEYYIKCLKINEKNNNREWMSSNLVNIGNIYKILGNYNAALEYYERALKIREASDDKSQSGSILLRIANNYRDQGDYDNALIFYNKLLEMLAESNEPLILGELYKDFGKLYEKKGEYYEALANYSMSLDIHSQHEHRRSIAHLYINIGSVQLKLNRLDKAVESCSRGLEFSEKINSIHNQKNACECLYSAYKTLGKNKDALEYYEKYTMFEDSLKKEETAKKLQQMEFAKQMLADSLAQEEEKLIVQHAHELEVNKKDKQRKIFMGIGLLVILIAVGLYSRLRYVRILKSIIEKEKDSSDNLLLNILPAEIAEELKEKGKADARNFDMVSILFTDFIEFTQTSSMLTAQELVSEINICFEAFDQIIRTYGIEKIKTIGDAYMAVGGLPVPTDDSVKNTILAALEMQAFIIDRKKEMQAKDQPAFEMRAGIHTGPVVAGIVGQKKFQYDIWGNTVNIASRMESNSEVGKVNISQITYDLIKDDKEFSFEKRGQIEVKGKGMMEMYFVDNVKM